MQSCVPHHQLSEFTLRRHQTRAQALADGQALAGLSDFVKRL
jgi:hypothetical protein